MFLNIKALFHSRSRVETTWSTQPHLNARLAWPAAIPSAMSTAIQNAAKLTQWGSIERHAWIVVLAANAILVAVILNSPHHAVYDEGIYLDAIKLLETEGFSRQFLLSYIGPAGPLHPVFYFPFIKLGMTFPYLRVISLALLLASAWLLSRVAIAGALTRNCDNRPVFIVGIGLVFGLLSNVKITHQFSSRYVFVFTPLLILSLAPALRPTWHLPLRIAVGAAIGLISAVSYLSFAVS
jgi:hypothetical protein